MADSESAKERRVRAAVRMEDLEREPAREEIVQAVLARVSNPTLEDEFRSHISAVSYWVLLSSGVNQADERLIAERLLLWHAFFARHDARVLCLQITDDVFQDCMRRFAIPECPALIISDRASFDRFVGLGRHSLARLMEPPDQLQRFLNNVHMKLLLQGSVAEIERQFRMDGFKEFFRIGWNELKDLVSVRLGT